MMGGRWREAEQRFNERRRREDEALRLLEKVPRLRSLKLEIEEHRGVSTLAETKHTRVVIVERAPALFVVPCGDRDCRDGGHDVTDAVLRALLAGEERFEVEDGCVGNIRSAECGRTVRIVAKATYA